MEGQKDWQVQPEHSGNLIRLLNLIRRAAGFRLLILQQNRPRYRDGLIAFLRESQEKSRVLNLKELGGFEAFESELEQGGQGQILHLINLESLGKKEQQAFFKGLNYHREYIARTCSGILVFWLPEPLVRDMALQAADFWAWREQVLDFTLPVEPVERILSDWGTLWNTDLPGKQKRIEEIENFLVHQQKNISLTTADLKRELGNLYESIGEYAKAANMLELAITEYGELDNAEARALARYDLARLLSVQGKLDQSLAIFKKQVLPTSERLGDLHNKAVTAGRIADILRQQGKLDEALYILEQEVLPVHERFDDVRGIAVTMGRIADILQMRGQLDKALKIRKEKELPLFEQIGDIRAKAVTIGKIADILWSRGQTDNALEIYQKEELPVYEKIGDVHSLLIGRTELALLFHEIDAETNKERIEELLRLALADARRLKLPKDTTWIEKIMKDMQIKP